MVIPTVEIRTGEGRLLLPTEIITTIDAAAQSVGEEDGAVGRVVGDTTIVGADQVPVVAPVEGQPAEGMSSEIEIFMDAMVHRRLLSRSAEGGEEKAC